MYVNCMYYVHSEEHGHSRETIKCTLPQGLEQQPTAGRLSAHVVGTGGQVIEPPFYSLFGSDPLKKPKTTSPQLKRHSKEHKSEARNTEGEAHRDRQEGHERKEREE